jgi:hypothetical protein
MAAMAQRTLAQTVSQRKSATTESSLWELAAKELDKKDYDRIGPIEKNGANIVNNVLKSVQKKKTTALKTSGRTRARARKLRSEICAIRSSTGLLSLRKSVTS